MTLKKSFYYLVAAFLFFYGCGGSEKSEKSGNSVVVRLESQVKLINPIINTNGYPRYVANHVFQTLTYFDPKTIEVKPWIIKSLPDTVRVTEGKYKGALGYTFELLDETSWDNGSPITSADVEFTMKLLMNPLLPTTVWRGYMDRLVGFEKDPTNPKKFTIYQKEYYILGLESISQFPIFPAYNYDPGNLLANISLDDLVDENKAKDLAANNEQLKAFSVNFNAAATGNDVTKISGSGAYKPIFLDEAQGVILVKKDNWYGTKFASSNIAFQAFPDTIFYKTITTEDATINQLRSGGLDIANNLSPTNFLDLQKDPAIAEKYNFMTHWSPTFSRLMLNHRDPLLTDKRVRQALAYAVDYNDLLTNIQQGMAERTIGPINPNNPNYAKNIVPYSFNPDKAKALLQEAGWTDSDNNGVVDKVVNGKKTELVLKLMNTTGAGVSDKVSAALILSTAKAGIKVELVAADINTITKETLAGRYQLASTASAWHPGTVDFHQVYHSSNINGGDNRSGFANEEMDKLIESIQVTGDEALRRPMYIRAQEILYDEVTEIFLYAPVTRVVIDKELEVELSALRPGYFENRFKRINNR